MSETNEPQQQQLAINGGQPAVTAAIPAWPISDDEILAVLQEAAQDNSWGTYHGRWVDQLKRQLSEIFLCEHVHCCSSGTIAVELALHGVGIKRGDEVILAGYDFPGNFRAIEAVGATPVLVDVVDDGWVIDPANVGSAVREQTRAIIVSHLHGQIADIPAIRMQLDQAGQPSIAIIEDVCQMPGGSLSGKPLGTLGDLSVLSFGGSKLISAGRGGAVLTNNPALAQRVKINNDRGNEAYPLSQLQAAVLGPQLRSLAGRNAIRQARVDQLLGQLDQLTTLTPVKQAIQDQRSAPAYFKLPFLLSSDTTQWQRERWIATAKAEGIPIDAGFRGFTNRSIRRCRKTGTLANSQIAAEQTLLLHHPVLLTDESTINEVAQGLIKIDIAAKFQMG